MNKRIPYLLWPGVGLVVIWFSPLFSIVYQKELVDSGLRHRSFITFATVWIVVFTIVSGLALLAQTLRSQRRNLPLSWWSTVWRMLVLAIVVLFSSMTAMQFPLSNLRGGEGWGLRETTLFLKQSELYLEYLGEDYGPRTLRKIPEGVSEFRNLPDEFREEMFGFAKDQELDAWGNPYMIVRKERGEENWIGIFSTGRDGMTSSAGNDLDDLNTWGRDWNAFYQTKRERPEGEISKIVLSAFLFFIPICFLTFRKPSFPDDQTA